MGRYTRNSIGKNIRALIDNKDEPHCFRLHDDRVYYVRYEILFQIHRTSIQRLQ